MSKLRVYLFLSVLAFVVPAQTGFAQYFQSLFDCDTTQDWAISIFYKPDSSFFTVNSAFSDVQNKWALVSMIISPDGQSVLSKKIVQTNYYYPYPGNPGEVKKLPGVNYIAPLTLANPNFYYSNLTAGFVKLTPFGDTIFMKTYFDTTPNATWLYCAAVLPNGHIMGGGAVGGNWSDYYSGLIICADSLGDTLWTKSYLIDTGHNVTINTIEPLDNGRVLVGATRNTRVEYDFSEWIDFNAPWFLIIDTNGNILKDTLYSYTQYWERLAGPEGGHLYKDQNGGFIHSGRLNQFVVSGALHLDDPRNCPTYFTHLDSNFRITWIDTLTYDPTFGQRLIYKIYQTSDSNYLVAGVLKDSTKTNLQGWIAKINKTGAILWQRKYQSDSTQDAYLEDLLQKPDGSIVLIGMSYNDTLPTWHDLEDVWLVGVDSTGCNVGGCWWPTETKDVQILNPDINVYPNPATGEVVIENALNSELEVIDMSGRRIKKMSISMGKQVVSTDGLAPGIYCFVFTDTGNGMRNYMRVVKE